MKLNKGIAFASILALSACKSETGVSDSAVTADTSTVVAGGIEDCRAQLEGMDIVDSNLHVSSYLGTTFESADYNQISAVVDGEEITFPYNATEGQWAQVVDGTLFDVYKGDDDAIAFMNYTTAGDDELSLGDEDASCHPVLEDGLYATNKYYCTFDLGGNISIDGDFETIHFNTDCDTRIGLQPYTITGSNDAGYAVEIR